MAYFYPVEDQYYMYYQPHDGRSCPPPSHQAPSHQTLVPAVHTAALQPQQQPPYQHLPYSDSNMGVLMRPYTHPSTQFRPSEPQPVHIHPHRNTTVATMNPYQGWAPVPSTGERQSLPSTDELQLVAATSELHLGPSTGELQSLPSTSQLQAVPTTSESQPVPTTSEPQPVPTASSPPRVTMRIEPEVLTAEDKRRLSGLFGYRKLVEAIISDHPQEVLNRKPPPPDHVPFDASDQNVRWALEIARESPKWYHDQLLKRILGRALSQIWSKLRDEPETYLLTRGEYSVLLFFRYLYEGNLVARRAFARYWDSCPPITAG